ncbi:MAG: cytochrome P450 [Verrucomicrobiales bacterium]|nr:cytochrome P450 [Verrucomicrobiales bacterium]
MSGDANSKGDEKKMQYGMLGEESLSVTEKLDKYTGEVTWKYLKSHFETGSLVYVDPALSITEVGEAFAADDAARVKAWRASGDVLTPSAPHAEYWEESEERFCALVVSPFVLMQPVQVLRD